MVSVTEYNPTENMLKVLDLAQAVHYEKDGQILCHDAGLARQRWYEWCKDERFVLWWNHESDKHLKTRLSRLRQATVTSAVERGNGASMRYNPASQKLALELIDSEYRQDQAEAHANANAEGVASFLAALAGGKAADEPDEPQE